MLDILLEAKKDGVDIDDEGIREEVDTFIFEGHDTTGIALSFALLLLANHPFAQDAVRSEIIDTNGDSDTLPTYSDLQKLEYTKRCLNESLRLYPGVRTIIRLVSEDVVTATGYKIPKGALIYLHIFDLHRNPNVFPDPDKFDPDRFLPENVQKRHPFAYLPFSAGPKNRIGQKFATLEMKAALCSILREFVLETVDTEEDVVLLVDLVLRTKNGIQIKFVPREKKYK